MGCKQCRKNPPANLRLKCVERVFFSLVLIVGRSKLLLLQVEFSATCNLSHQCVRFRTSGSCSGEKMACSEWHTHYGVPEMWQCFIYQWHSSHAKNQHNNDISSFFFNYNSFFPYSHLIFFEIEGRVTQFRAGFNGNTDTAFDALCVHQFSLLHIWSSSRA